MQDTFTTTIEAAATVAREDVYPDDFDDLPSAAELAEDDRAWRKAVRRRAPRIDQYTTSRSVFRPGVDPF